MARAKQRRMHIAIDPPVQIDHGDRRVSFVGLNLINNVVMVEYDVDPPLHRARPFGPELLQLRVHDDTSDDPYPTIWEDFPWPWIAPGRLTTRLDRRPPAEARLLHFDVLPAGTDLPVPAGPQSVAMRRIDSFDVELPSEHGLPWTPPQTATG